MDLSSFLISTVIISHLLWIGVFPWNHTMARAEWMYVSFDAAADEDCGRP
jgi:hypothetical protein